MIKKRIAILTVAIGQEYSDAVAMGLHSKRLYCNHHGYELILITERCTDRPPSWEKIASLKRCLNDFDVVFLSDADVIITNQRIEMHQLFTKALSQDCTFLISRDAAGNINCGNFFAFNNEKTFCDLDKIWNKTEYIDHPWWENMAFIDLYEKDSQFSSSVYVEADHPRAFNAYCHVGAVDKRYKPGDFLMHFAGVSNPGILKLLMESAYLFHRQSWDRQRIRLLLKILSNGR